MPGGNYGTGGFGQGANAGAAKMAVARSNPYTAIAQFLVGTAAQNVGGSIDDSQRINQEVNTKGGRDINAEHSSPFGVADEMGSQMMPGAEKMLSANTKPLAVSEGAYSIQPFHVDSSQQAAPSSAMTDYLNYMKYRGGY